MDIITATDIRDIPLAGKGKVRDIYELDPETLVIVTTDRMSAFDVVMREPIPYKGVVLNQITLFWMDHFAEMVANHLVATRVEDFPAQLAPYARALEGRAVIVRRAEPLPIECIVRGHITGSGWKDYQRTGQVCGHPLPKDLKESQQLLEPLFTPSTKAELGEHDENITLEKAIDMVGKATFDKVQDLSLKLYAKGRDHAAERGIIIADTKFEFGLIDGEPVLIDEVLTPDSSRFWPAEGFAPGKGQPSFDKQYLRDYLQTLDWNKEPPPPPLPEDVVENTRKRYFEAYAILTGATLDIPGA